MLKRWRAKRLRLDFPFLLLVLVYRLLLFCIRILNVITFNVISDSQTVEVSIVAYQGVLNVGAWEAEMNKMMPVLCSVPVIKAAFNHSPRRGVV